MRSQLGLSIALILACAGGPEAPATTSTAVVREEKAVEVDGISEIWRLEWTQPPDPICAPGDGGWYTCPCEGFAFGESGELDLVRIRSSREVDRLRLTAFFLESDLAVLQRWPVVESDDEWIDADLDGRLAEFRETVRKRPPVSVLDVGDFNRDGRATEFLLQVGVMPCGKRQSILVGVSPDRPRLHAFGSADHPEKPLVLYPSQWERLRTSSGPLRLEAWPCGDHGSEVHNEITLEVDDRGIHAALETFSCDAPGQTHGALLSREIL
jgi:hypothetical protein